MNHRGGSRFQNEIHEDSELNGDRDFKKRKRRPVRDASALINRIISDAAILKEHFRGNIESHGELFDAVRS
jgi:hypothetical protein